MSSMAWVAIATATMSLVLVSGRVRSLRLPTKRLMAMAAIWVLIFGLVVWFAAHVGR